ncbi:SufE family protein [Frateuria aurantia]|uniref:SufE protein probably involved in Fe-S center assembly n=1 Tax=Frateuria aurantia (strain ATCC 33424 / DSM 6220 / KCTC 2777 / LMG 1558 / NBRC 3245 / NCIMB 13370) TaxID=767434 RepID=H8L3I4_FRAAD|nr:SufE family protein [Frateuria aurantia]AFC86502.1 SufE protein probably involved in Fe-S center assembly [Frateuria aurantia DSM 6220]
MTEPLEPTAAAAQEAIADEFALFGDWSERYQYLIDLGKQLRPLDEADKTESYRIIGCQSRVWLVPSGTAERLHFEAGSDSAIVSGLIALVLRVYSDRPASEILSTEPDFIQAIGLARHLSPTRSNGLAAMLVKLKAYAASLAGTAPA